MEAFLHHSKNLLKQAEESLVKKRQVPLQQLIIKSRSCRNFCTSLVAARCCFYLLTSRRLQAQTNMYSLFGINEKDKVSSITVHLNTYIILCLEDNSLHVFFLLNVMDSSLSNRRTARIIENMILFLRRVMP